MYDLFFMVRESMYAYVAKVRDRFWVWYGNKEKLNMKVP